jgi:hypothetical protein
MVRSWQVRGRELSRGQGEDAVAGRQGGAFDRAGRCALSVSRMSVLMFTLRHHRGPLSLSTLERIRVTLRVAMNAAIREGLIEHNPA